MQCPRWSDGSISFPWTGVINSEWQATMWVLGTKPWSFVGAASAVWYWANSLSWVKFLKEVHALTLVVLPPCHPRIRKTEARLWGWCGHYSKILPQTNNKTKNKIKIKKQNKTKDKKKKKERNKEVRECSSVVKAFDYLIRHPEFNLQHLNRQKSLILLNFFFFQDLMAK